MFPIAATTIMQLFAPPPQAAPPAAQANGSNPDAGAEVPLDLSKYYADADQIPEYARDEVAIATQAGLIVNYPDVRLLNPNQPISRGSTAALIYQVLENRGELEPLPDTSESLKYVVDPTIAP
ncbi:MAG: S-layer homology domain-containing protein [Phormidesmis sp.]